MSQLEEPIDDEERKRLDACVHDAVGQQLLKFGQDQQGKIQIPDPQKMLTYLTSNSGAAAKAATKLHSASLESKTV